MRAPERWPSQNTSTSVNTNTSQMISFFIELDFSVTSVLKLLRTGFCPAEKSAIYE
jgi:hypothetical protein